MPAKNDAPAAAIEKDSRTTTTTGDGGGYTVQVAAVGTVQQADQILQKLTDKGYPAYTVQTGSGATTQFLVRIGFFAEEKATDQLMKKLKADQYDPALVRF